MPPSGSLFREWFQRTLGEATPAQAAAWPLIRSGHHVLIVSPPGTGKTLAAFLEILDRLASEHASHQLEETIHCLYLSPLRALGYDLSRNLQAPLQAIYGPEPPLRIGLRTGDTPPAERERQRTRPPHLLLTTPESLALLLSQSRWLPALSRVRWIIVDEIHALAETKRGSHLSLSLERLDALRRTGAMRIAGELPHRVPPAVDVQRIGLSATVAPPEEAARFLTGTDRTCQIVNISAIKQIDLRVFTPLGRNPYPAAGFAGTRLLRDLARLVQNHRTTLIFTNTRSGAEITAHGLKQQLPKIADQIECHHASLDRDLRLDVEDRLKRGELRAVVCSTSLELGIDIGSIDLVVMVSTPKGISRALQRTGRAGHNLRDISRGLLMATNVNDLVECAATARLARTAILDEIRIPVAPLDVLAQHLMGLGCLGETKADDAFALVRRAWPYRALLRSDFDDVLDYLAGGGKSLRQQYTDVFGKIVFDAERGVFEARAGAPRQDFLQNVGTIPTDGSIRILLRHTPLGTVEESFLRRLNPGDIFSLGGRALRLEKVGMMEAWVTRAEGATPTVPRWGANKMPLSNRVGQEIAAFRSELRTRLEALPFRESPSLIPWIARRLECEPENAAVIFRIHATQSQVSEIPTRDFLLIEELVEAASEAPTNAPPRTTDRTRRRQAPTPGPAEEPFLFAPSVISRLKQALSAPAPNQPSGPPAGRHHYFFHSLIGRAANDALSRVVALRLARRGGGNVIASPDDYGFVLTMTDALPDQAELRRELFTTDGFLAELESSLARSELLKYHFRGAAQTGLMVYRNHFGQQKPLRKLQWSAEVIFNVLADHEPGHVLMREARRDTVQGFLDAPGALAFLDDFCRRDGPVHRRRVAQVTPLSFAMYATRIREALLLEDPRETQERLYHQWWAALHPEPPSEQPDRVEPGTA